MSARTDTPALVAETDGYKVYAVRWPVLQGVDGEGLLLEPNGKPVASVVAIPGRRLDAGDAGRPGRRACRQESQFARRLAENGCRVLVPALIDRKDTWSGNPSSAMTNQPHREFVYRMAFEMGRHIIGYEVQKVLAGGGLVHAQDEGPPARSASSATAKAGCIAFYSAALDTRGRARPSSAATSARARSCGRSRSTATSGACLREFGDAERRPTRRAAQC